MKPRALTLGLVLLAGLPAVTSGHNGHHPPMSPPTPAPSAPAERLAKLQIPDTPLRDQEGRPVRFYSDLVAGRVVAVNFVFTSCTTICPPMGAGFGRLRTMLGDRAGRDVHLISVSVDPVTDTPAKLKAWSEKFGAGRGWTLVTGDRDEVTRLLKALGAYAPNPEAHSPLVLLGNDARGEWTRANGLSTPAQLASLLDGLAAPAGGRVETLPAPPRSAAHSYFGDIPLVDQDGRTHRLYSDLLADKIVVIDFMFTECGGACPMMSRTFEKIQERLGDRVGKDVYLLSFSVDPANDTPAKLKEYAARFHARPGWYFLTGDKANLEAALRKLGGHVEQREGHSNLFILGNGRTGLWKKAFGLADPAEVLKVVDSVVNDRG